MQTTVGAAAAAAVPAVHSLLVCIVHAYKAPWYQLSLLHSALEANSYRMSAMKADGACPA
jgi:hypothetical protein